LNRRDWIAVVAATAIIAGLIGAIVGVLAGMGSQQTVVEKYFPNKSELAHPIDIQGVLAKVEPAVVSIDTTVYTGGTGDNSQLVEGAGSGMILTPTGEVLTNNHVVAGANTVTVTLFGQTKALTAHVIGTDPSQDVALVQIDGQHDLPTVHLGDSNTALVGDDVVAIGNALALQGGPTVTAGIVSAKNRSLSAQADFSNAMENLNGLLQTDAPINPGNSGGPLADSHGDVIGMNTAVAESGSGNAPAQNIGFAIAIDSIKPLLVGLQHGGTGGVRGGVPAQPVSHTAYMGVVVENVTPQLAQQQHLTPTSGAFVSGVSPGGPADKAGIKQGDVIVSIGGHSVSNVTQLVKEIRVHPPGTTVPVVIYRGPTKMTVSVTLSNEPG